MSLKSTVSDYCKSAEHNYVPAPEAHGVERRNVPDGTEIWLAYVCSKCAHCRQVKVATWQKQNNTFTPKNKPMFTTNDPF